MERKRINTKVFLLFLLWLLFAKARPQNFDRKDSLGVREHKGCAYLNCDENSACTNRKFRCREPPCASMLYCARSQTESLKGPSTCETVRCSNGHVCTLKVRRCHWDLPKCEQQVARCVSKKEYHEGPASCAGFNCPQGSHCILRESFCINPPCKLLRSCLKNKEVHTWFAKCRSLGCPSEFECFLRRPESNCYQKICRHSPDCVITTEEEITNEHCRGWICPRDQKCYAEIIGDCKFGDCDINRTCKGITSNYSKVLWKPLKEEEEQTPPKSSPQKQQKSLLHEKNLTNIIENLLLSNKILETALLNNLKQPNRSPLWYMDQQELPPLLIKNKDIYEQPYFVVPVKSIKNINNLAVKEDSMLDENLRNYSVANFGEQKGLNREGDVVKNNEEAKMKDFEEIQDDFLEKLVKDLELIRVEDGGEGFGERFSGENVGTTSSNGLQEEETTKANISIDETDLNVFLELNKDILLPYIQNLMDESNENVSSSSLEPNPEDSSIIHALLKNNSVRGQLGLIYSDENSTIRSFYGPPSYGASDSGGIFEENSNLKTENNNN